MARPMSASIVLAAANPAAICASQTPGSAGGLNLTAPVVTLDVARRVLVTTAGNETGKTITISGKNSAGAPITETLALPNASTVYTTQDFALVSSVWISAGAAGAIQVGTNGIASTQWLRLDYLVKYFQAGIAVNLGGNTANVTVEVTLDEVDKAALDNQPGNRADSSTAGLPYSLYTPPVPFSVSGMSSLSADTLGSLTIPCRAARLTVNSGATVGAVRITVIQAGI
jgi:hypothetical protein